MPQRKVQPNSCIQPRARHAQSATLLEIYGPLMMSYPVVSNVQYRLSEEAGGTLIKFHHTALGAVPDSHRQGFPKGWSQIHARARQRAEAASSR